MKIPAFSFEILSKPSEVSDLEIEIAPDDFRALRCGGAPPLGPREFDGFHDFACFREISSGIRTGRWIVFQLRGKVFSLESLVWPAVASSDVPIAKVDDCSCGQKFVAPKPRPQKVRKVVKL